MSKNLLFKLLVALAGVVVAVLWLLSVIPVNGMKFFSLSWAITIFAGMAGVAYLLRGMLSKTVGMVKKFYVYLGCALLVVAVFSLISALAMPAEHLVMPIIAIAVTVALLIGMLVVGGKKWDTADNQKIGYKNYYERKKEEEAAKAKEDKE